MIFKRNNTMKTTLLILVGLSLVLAACLPKTEPPPVNMEEPGVTREAIETEETGEPSGEVEAAPEEPETLIPPAEPEMNTLPPDPILQAFQTIDGVELQGMFYPAETTSSPVIVLMHWAIGDQTDWRAIAPWLQNRGYAADLPEGGQPWLDPSWFPELPSGQSYNVFTFTFRDCVGGCQSFNREGWLLDVEAAMSHVIGLENVDLSRVVTMGASIGADGAAYGCHYFNIELGGCQGALSLSPGGFLTIPYPEEVANLEEELISRPAWCLYGADDPGSADACQNASGELYQATEYPGSAHGMDLIKPGMDPDPLNLILEFLELYLECESCSL
jgi:dienelactone hydrolase